MENKSRILGIPNRYFILLFIIIGVDYYLIVLKYVYLYQTDDDDKPVPMTRPDALALGLLTFGIILVGTLFAPWWGLAEAAAAALF